ncbi:2-hydroxyhepta-2,4-diene-1,7-dioate isomerase [Cupriavidus sp. USMAA2-4]|uniref:2-hydroxyhepta-2,4-diene-1,7-dioate isomerase n=1 Tax=Cupriavidus malaysiensis TaxID=367825 RepID=A0A1D9I938_9BURK|nr:MULTISPECIES: fumarylacetoacetate hydrolase family protein [Cupriavidus]AOY95392.1 2-hydroxyhepta-2,4-diene-1,7-dioate isomerase [Cupriavidus sp. USMAA2-4]AOZ01687.1 2-hydroxyhepta-2,4-diene-1,7-dioate isomerase [Cupriavidus sp. USMAHM13]AOZ08563.1 2-hydroxyhepta-2,4-diene-1,7-dioate isomerase [Cupriavidus malaysiensis]
MKLCRFNNDRVGVVLSGQVVDVTEAVTRVLEGLPPVDGDPLIAYLDQVRAGLPSDLLARQAAPASAVSLLAPVRLPGKIVAAPVNYHAHIAEMLASNISPGHNLADIEKAGLFLKATSSLVGAAQGVAVRFPERRTDYEVELVAVIGRAASEVPVEEALDYVAGYAVGLDITVRGTEDRSFRKSIDSYTVLGPWLTTRDEIEDPNALRLWLSQNGIVRQNTSTADMVLSVAELIAFASRFYTLKPGDLLFTGTPEGVGPIHPGDFLHAACDGLDAMDVRVRAYGDEA